MAVEEPAKRQMKKEEKNNTVPKPYEADSIASSGKMFMTLTTHFTGPEWMWSTLVDRRRIFLNMDERRA